MIIKEFYRTRSDGVDLYKIFSDKNVYIIKNGKKFASIITINQDSDISLIEETEYKIPTTPKRV